MHTRPSPLTLLSAAGILLIPVALAIFADVLLLPLTALAPAVALAQPLLAPHASGAMRPIIPMLPEAGTLALVGTMLIGLAAVVRKRPR